MPLKNILWQRLLSLLQPWLREKPELDISFGLFNSLLVVSNLSFDVSTLNQLFDDPACLFLKDVIVERLSVRFSSWDTPAFTIEVHGVRIVLSFENPEGEKYPKRSRRSKYDYSKNLTKKLSAGAVTVAREANDSLQRHSTERKDGSAGSWFTVALFMKYRLALPNNLRLLRPFLGRSKRRHSRWLVTGKPQMKSQSAKLNAGRTQQENSHRLKPCRRGRKCKSDTRPDMEAYLRSKPAAANWVEQLVVS